MRAIIIDQENEIKTLKTLISYYCPNLKVVDSDNSFSKAKKIIQDKKPDIVFLDFSNKNNLELINEINFHLIFLINYNDYAIKSIKSLKLSQNDFLIKPINPDELISSVNRTNNSLEESRFKFRILKNNLNGHQTKLIIDGPNGVFCIRVKEIKFIKANKSLSIIHLIDRKKSISFRNIAHFEEILESRSFARIKRDLIINLNFKNDFKDLLKR